MNTKLLLWAFAALSIGSSAYAADSKSEMDGCQHPCPMMSDGSKMDDMHKGMGMGDSKKAREYSSKGKIIAFERQSDPGEITDVTLAHEPVPSLKWPTMTMGFWLASPKVARGVSPGDTVSFRFVERGGGYIVTHLEKSGS